MDKSEGEKKKIKRRRANSEAELILLLTEQILGHNTVNSCHTK